MTVLELYESQFQKTANRAASNPNSCELLAIQRYELAAHSLMNKFYQAISVVSFLISRISTREIKHCGGHHKLSLAICLSNQFKNRKIEANDPLHRRLLERVQRGLIHKMKACRTIVLA